MMDPRDSDRPFGVLDFLPWRHDWNGQHYTPEKVERSLRLMDEAGVAFVRMDFLWHDIEPVRGTFDFGKYDGLVDQIISHGIKILGLLVYSPTWDGQPWNRAPDPALYSRYARRVLSRYKDRIRHWEIWNEPDHPTFWEPQDNMQSYCALLKYVYPILKQEDPTSLIHLAGTSKGLPASVRSVYANGAKDFFDIAHIHPYTNPLIPNALDGMRALYDSVRRMMADYDDSDKPVWFTELGCPGLANPHAVNPWWFGKNPSEDEQAAWVQTVYREALGWQNVEKIFWCYFRDVKDHWHSGEDYMGLIRNDFSKKPGFEAYRKAATAPSLA